MRIRGVYGLAKRMKRGIRLKIFPTFKCNLDCAYCGNDLGVGLDPIDRKTLDVDDWVDLIQSFPVRVREVVISGGEPTIYPGMVTFINKLLELGYFVTVFTNLTNKYLINTNKSFRLRIYATFHGRHYDKNRFLSNYYAVTKKHRVDVNEIAEQRLSFSKVDPWGCDLEQAKTINKNYFWISPDGMIHTSCYAVMYSSRKIKP